MKRLPTYPIAMGCLLVMLSGCIVDLDEETFAPGRLTERCVYPNAPGLAEQSGAFSLAFEEDVYWIFGPATLAAPNAHGETVLSNVGAMAHTAPTACSGELEYVTDADGQFTQIIPFTDEERAFNAARPAGPQIALWPLSGFVHQNTGWVYYRKVLVYGFLDVTDLGTGLARLEAGGVATRLRPNVDPAYPTLLWRSPEVSWGTGAFLDRDGFAYVYGCFRQSDFERGCRVARVPAEAAADPSAYTYYDAFNAQWLARPENASVVFTGPMTVSAGYNAYLDRYVVVYAPVLSNDVEMRTAPHPWGPFAPGRTLFTGDPPAFLFIRDVQAHPAYHRDGGKTLFVSYYSTPADGTAGLRLGYYELD